MSINLRFAVVGTNEAKAHSPTMGFEQSRATLLLIRVHVWLLISKAAESKNSERQKAEGTKSS